MIAGGKISEDEEIEDESAPAAGSPKPVEVGVDPKQAEPDVGAKEVVPEPAETTASAEDIAGN